MDENCTKKQTNKTTAVWLRTTGGGNVRAEGAIIDGGERMSSDECRTPDTEGVEAGKQDVNHTGAQNEEGNENMEQSTRSMQNTPNDSEQDDGEGMIQQDNNEQKEGDGIDSSEHSTHLQQEGGSFTKKGEGKAY